MSSKIVFLLALVLSVLFGRAPIYGQENWKLKSDRDGIAIFLRSLPDSKFKAVKVECELAASLSQLVAVILDVNTGDQWVYSTKSSVLLKQVSPSELYYYSEVNIPWPASNRDFIAHLTAVQDPHSKVVTIYGPTVPYYVPVKNDIVRITQSEGKWVITPVGLHKIKVEYTLRVDPGGNIPAWLINLFAAKGPYESFKNLRGHLQKPAYANVHLPFIID
ncbi:MAG TPA: START domain-containing protein [Puia sp.]|nr:START domain-containing protein [Puia sp.]